MEFCRPDERGREELSLLEHILSNVVNWGANLPRAACLELCKVLLHDSQDPLDTKDVSLNP